MKRLGRYLARRPRLVCRYGYQGAWGPRAESIRHVEVPVDSNWADCKLTRKSTSGGAIRHGGHILCTWSVTQAVQALSSGEAEFYSVLKGAVEALGFQALAEELGCDFAAPRVGSDSSAARGVASLHGLGKLKNLQLKYLWVRSAV